MRFASASGHFWLLGLRTSKRVWEKPSCASTKATTMACTRVVAGKRNSPRYLSWLAGWLARRLPDSDCGRSRIAVSCDWTRRVSTSNAYERVYDGLNPKVQGTDGADRLRGAYLWLPSTLECVNAKRLNSERTLSFACLSSGAFHETRFEPSSGPGRVRSTSSLHRILLKGLRSGSR